MAIIFSILLGFLPTFLFAAFVYWLDHYEKEPLKLLGVIFGWGMIVAAGFAFIANTLLGQSIFQLTGSETATNFATSTLVAPIIEETIKGLAVLIVFYLYRSEFDSILDGIIYAGVVALGFAASENTYYIYNGYASNGYPGLLTMAFVRVVLVGWQHPFYTSFIGIGLAISRLTNHEPLKLAAPLTGWGLSVILHSLHNLIASSDHSTALFVGTSIDWVGWGIMFGFIIYLIRQEQKNLSLYLQDEVTAGTITGEQYQAACSPWLKNAAWLTAFSAGKLRLTLRFYQVCGELAHKKHQFNKMGKETNNDEIIRQLQNELAELSPQLR